MSTTLEVAPMQWGLLKDLDDVGSINDSDVDCLAEVREVLKKHGKRERFGVALLHRHFDMDQFRGSQPGRQLLRDMDRAVTPAGAADRQGEIALSLALITRQQRRQQPGQRIEEPIEARIALQIGAHRPIAAAERPQRRRLLSGKKKDEKENR